VDSDRQNISTGLACGELFNPEISRERAASVGEMTQLWQSLDALVDVVDLNSPVLGDRFP